MPLLRDVVGMVQHDQGFDHGRYDESVSGKNSLLSGDDQPVWGSQSLILRRLGVGLRHDIPTT